MDRRLQRLVYQQTVVLGSSYSSLSSDLWGEAEQVWFVVRWTNHGRGNEECMRTVPSEGRYVKNRRIISVGTFTLKQDEDVLDTWFSSSLLPLSVTQSLQSQSPNPMSFYPFNVLETGNDILFFWVIRMAFMCKTLSNTAPFQNVYCYSVVRLLNRLFCIAPFEMLAVERCPSPAVMWSIPNTSLMAWQRRRWSRPSRRARWVTRKRRWKSTWWKRPIPKYIDVFFYDS